jgi:predicted GTPase
MRLIDPTKVRQTVTRTHLGRNIRHTEHHNGIVDAEVKLTAIKITANAPPSKPLVEAMGELEAATREWRVAKHSDSDEWKRFVKTRLRVANERVQEVQ